MVAEHAQPRHADALGAERRTAGVEQPRHSREAVQAGRKIGDLARWRPVGVPVALVVGDLVGHALVLRQVTRVGPDRDAVEQVDLPAELVELGVVDVVAGGDRERERQPGHGAAPDPAQGPGHRIGDVRREHLVGAVGALERQVRRERRVRVVVAVEELDAGRGLRVQHVHVGELAERDQRAPVPAAVVPGHALQELVADQVRLARPDHDLAVATGARRTAEQGLGERRAPPARMATLCQRRVERSGADRHAAGEPGAQHRSSGDGALALDALPSSGRSSAMSTPRAAQVKPRRPTGPRAEHVPDSKVTRRSGCE